MATTLRISDGTTTIDLNASGGTWELEDADWTPALAEPRLDELGGRGPVEDAVEAIPLLAFGSTRAAVQAAIHALQLLTTQAVRAQEFAESAIVRLQYLPDGSSLGSAVEAPILGAAREGEPTLTYGTIRPVPSRGYMAKVRLRLRRGGLWVGAADTASSSSAANPAILTATLASHDTRSPASLVLTGTGGSGWAAASGARIPPGRLIFTDNANKIQILEAESGIVSGFSSDSSAATTARQPRGGAVARYNGTAPLRLSWSLPSSFGTLARRVRAFLNVRNSASGASFLAEFSVKTASHQARARLELIPAGMGAPDWIDLGTVALPDDLATAPALTAEVLFAFASFTGSTNYFDIDAIVLVALDEATSIITFDGALINSSDYGANSLRLLVDPGYTSRPQPLVAIERASPSTIRSGIGARGDDWPAQSGTAAAAVYLSTGRAQSGTSQDFYRQVDPGGTTVISNTLTVTRLRGYVSVP